VSGSDEMPPSPFEVLNFLCVTLARKPLAVSFRQGAAVARNLDDLVYELAPGRERQRILLLSRAIWGMVFQFSKFKTATKEETITFWNTLTERTGSKTCGPGIEPPRHSNAFALQRNSFPQHLLPPVMNYYR
jgi:hypothetical protein